MNNHQLTEIINDLTHGLVDEDTLRMANDEYPMLKYESQPPYLLQLFKVIEAKDNEMIESLAETIEKKEYRLQKLEETDLFEKPEADIKRIQAQKEYLYNDLKLLRHCAKLIVRSQERWFYPEMSRINTEVLEWREKGNTEIQFWHGNYLSEIDESAFYLKGWHDTLTELQAVKEKLNQYQNWYITYLKNLPKND